MMNLAASYHFWYVLFSWLFILEYFIICYDCFLDKLFRSMLLSYTFSFLLTNFYSMNFYLHTLSFIILGFPFYFYFIVFKSLLISSITSSTIIIPLTIELLTNSSQLLKSSCLLTPTFRIFWFYWAMCHISCFLHVS